MPDPTEPPQDEFVDVRPVRLRARLVFWITLSVAIHLFAGAALALSPELRNWLFSSLNGNREETISSSQLQAARNAIDQLTRKRIIACSERMQKVSKRISDLRRKHWDEVADRGRDNPGFAAMHQSGLPKLPVAPDGPGTTAEEVPPLYARARSWEQDVIGVYEQYKAVGLSLMTVAKGADGTATPQPLAQSLGLVKLERPERTELNQATLNGTFTDMKDGSWLAFRAEMTRASDTAEIMANNCDRIMQVIENILMIIDSGSSGIAGGPKGQEKWTEDNIYKGDQLRPIDMVPSQLRSLDTNAKVSFGKDLGAKETSRSVDWLAIDTWWQIGPFPYLDGSRSTQSLNHAYPPEYGVDLDAVYEGKGGRKLGWFYSPFSQVRMEPRDVTRESIWYLYTEFNSDSDREVWANIASDDYGVLWLNGEREPVYRSSVEPRPWVILDARQFVKLKVRAGTNSLLFKLDNNRGTTGFTVIFSLIDMGM